MRTVNEETKQEIVKTQQFKIFSDKLQEEGRMMNLNISQEESDDFNKLLERYVIDLISKIQEEKLKNCKKESFCESFQTKLPLKDSNVPIFVDVNIFMPDNHKNIESYLEKKKELQLELLHSKNKRKTSFFTKSEETSVHNQSWQPAKTQVPLPSKTSGDFTQLIIPKFNKFKPGNAYSESNSNSFLFQPPKNLLRKRSFSIFKNNQRRDFCTRERLEELQIKGFREKVKKFKNFWSKESTSYPYAFVKKSFGNDYGCNEFFFNEVFDISNKVIPFSEDSENPSNLP